MTESTIDSAFFVDNEYETACKLENWRVESFRKRVAAAAHDVLLASDEKLWTRAVPFFSAYDYEGFAPSQQAEIVQRHLLVRAPTAPSADVATHKMSLQRAF
jgi:hypothetical protein